MEDRGQRCGEGGSEGGLELVVAVDADTDGAEALRDLGPVDRAEVGPDRGKPAPNLVVVDRAVLLVVEHQHDRVDALADRGLELRDRHGRAAVTGQCHDRPAGPRE